MLEGFPLNVVLIEHEKITTVHIVTDFFLLSDQWAHSQSCTWDLALEYSHIRLRDYTSDGKTRMRSNVCNRTTMCHCTVWGYESFKAGRLSPFRTQQSTPALLAIHDISLATDKFSSLPSLLNKSMMWCHHCLLQNSLCTNFNLLAWLARIKKM